MRMRPLSSNLRISYSELFCTILYSFVKNTGTLWASSIN